MIFARRLVDRQIAHDVVRRRKTIVERVTDARTLITEAVVAVEVGIVVAVAKEAKVEAKHATKATVEVKVGKNQQGNVRHLRRTRPNENHTQNQNRETEVQRNLGLEHILVRGQRPLIVPSLSRRKEKRKVRHQKTNNLFIDHPESLRRSVSFSFIIESCEITKNEIQ